MNLRAKIALADKFNFESSDPGADVENNNIYEQPAQPVYTVAGVNAGR